MLRIRLNINKSYQEDGLSASQKIIRDLIGRKISVAVIAKEMGVARYVVIDLISGEAINPNVAALNKLLRFYMEVSKHSDIHQESKNTLIDERGGKYAY